MLNFHHLETKINNPNIFSSPSLFSAIKQRERETYENICQDRNLERWVRGRWGKGSSPLKS
jgi:hypothetical protein